MTDTMFSIHGKFLVKGSRSNSPKLSEPSPILCSTESLSFWGGIDPISGIIIDSSHPLHGICVSDTIFVLPSGRGSCTASQVLLELIRNGIAPRAIVLRDVDGLVAVGAIVAEEVFQTTSLDILHIGDEAFQKIAQSSCSYGLLSADGTFDLAPSLSDLTVKAKNVDADEDSGFHFTDLERQMLDEATNEATKMALRVIFRYAHITSNSQETTYVPVTQAHIDGCTYIGPGGLSFAQRLVEAGGKVTVPTTLNSMSTDRRRWSALGVPSDYAQNAIALGDAYLQLGCRHSFTCAPYLLESAPGQSEDIVWGESNAVVFANSVLGARTEKYADYLDICCALAGIVPASGVHLVENRIPEIVLDATELFSELDVDEDTSFSILFPVLGHLCGSLSDGKVPILVGMEKLASGVTQDQLKSFCAAFGTTGTSPLIHIAGVTPEARDSEVVREWVYGISARSTITMEQLDKTFTSLDSGQTKDDDSVALIALGNPHLSVEECRDLAAMIVSNVENVTKSPTTRIVACMSREIQVLADKRGYIEPLKSFGVEFVNDTCWCMLLDEPVIPPQNTTILTNSGKYAHYGPGLTSRRFRFGSTADCIRAAQTGTYPRLNYPSRPGHWLQSKRSYSQLTGMAVRRSCALLKYMF